MVRQDVVDDLPDPLRALEELLAVDVLDLDVQRVRALLLLVLADVLDREPEDVLVPDGVDDDVLVQALPEEVRRRPGEPGRDVRVVGEDRRAGEAEHLGLGEEPPYILVGLAELATVALVENEDDLAVLQVPYFPEVAFL